MKVLSLFSGIGGLDLAAEWAGMEVVAFCEIEPYAVKVLKRRWPDVPVFGDVCTLTGDSLSERGIRPDDIDCIIGGFPCQPFSVAGKRKGAKDERFLWGEFSRLIEEIRPRWIVAENVPGLIRIALDDVLSDLESKGYACLPIVYPASAVGAPHRRERVFIVAHNSKQGLQGGEASRNNVTNRPEPLDELAPRCCAGNLWPTPDCSDRRRGLSEKSGDGLATAVQNWPTPSTMDNIKRSGMRPSREATGRKTGYLSEHINGQLNPDWVEILMGFAIGWTDIDAEPQEWPGWPAGMEARMWMTPKASICGMTAKTKGRPLEMATHLSSQTFVAESDGANQHPYEPPRTTKIRKNRAKRLRCLGNAVVPQQAYPIFRAIMEVEA